MGTVVEWTATIILMLLLIIAVAHALNGTFLDWVSSKFKVVTGPQGFGGGGNFKGGASGSF